MKTITITDKTRIELWNIKLELDHSTLDETIQYLLFELGRPQDK